jgi:hypothetical protein
MFTDQNRVSVAVVSARYFLMDAILNFLYIYVITPPSPIVSTGPVVVSGGWGGGEEMKRAAGG